MTNEQLTCIFRAIEALTCSEIIRDGEDVTDTVPILVRSMAFELRQIEKELGASGRTRLHSIAAAIDEALLALEEVINDH